MKPIKPPIWRHCSASLRTSTRTLFARCLLLAVWMQAAPASAAAPLTWPNQGPYRTVGEPNSGYPVEMPLSVVKTVQQTVPDDPSQWIIRPMHDFSKRGKRVWVVTGRLKGYLCLLVEPQFWINLSAPGNAPFLNEVLAPLPAADLQD